MSKLFKQPIVFFILADILIFTLLFLYREPADPKILITAMIVLVLTLFTYLVITYFNWGDKYIFLIASMLVTLGIAMLYRLDYARGLKQIGWYVFGIAVFVIAFFAFRYINFWDKIPWFYFAVSVAMFGVVQVFGRTIGGAKNWLFIGGYSIQPSEITKILFVLFLACYFHRKDKENYRYLPEKYIMMFCAFFYCGCLILQREWGSTVLLFAVYFLLLYIYRNDWLMLLGNIGLMGVVGFLGYKFLFHIQTRVAMWLNPWSDPSVAGYQIIQSLFAIAAGDFFGTGIGLGMPQLIPYVESDFIFAAICEELGVFGGVAVILLFFILIYRCFKISLAQDAADEPYLDQKSGEIVMPSGASFYKCVAVGIALMLALQTFIIIGGVVKLIPLTGITLPFISYGGTSLLTSFAMLGIIQGISAKGIKKQ